MRERGRVIGARLGVWFCKLSRMSFPRKRESRATATSLALDPRFRGGDSPREMRKQQAFDLILAPMTLSLSHKAGQLHMDFGRLPSARLSPAAGHVRAEPRGSEDSCSGDPRVKPGDRPYENLESPRPPRLRVQKPYAPQQRGQMRLPCPQGVPLDSEPTRT